MKTTMRTAYKQVKYQIPLPEAEEVKKAILELEWPPEGLMIAEAAKKLAEKWELSEEQQTAVNKSGFKVFRHDVVAPLFRTLLKEGVLKQPGGTRKPYFLVADSR